MKYFNFRSLWYITHGFQSHYESLREVIGTGQCLLKYNYKGGQSERVISPIKLKQLFIPFVILLCGWLLAFFQFLRELMHAHFDKQMMNQVNSVPPVVTPTAEVVVDPDTGSPPAEPIIENLESKQVRTNASTVVTVIVIEAPLTVVDISNDSNQEVAFSRPALPNEIK